MDLITPPATEAAPKTRAAFTPAHDGRATLSALPHEWAFGAFLLYTALRLVLAGHLVSRYTVLFLALSAGGWALNWWTAAHPSRLRWNVRLIWYPSIMGVSFYALAGVIPLLGTPSADRDLAAWDERLLGRPAADLFVGVQSVAFSDVMVVAYLLFFFYLHLGPAHYCLTDVARFRTCFAGMFTVYALGFTGYTLLPAAGPPYAIAFATELPGGAFKESMLAGVNSASNGFDVFPSLHIAVTLYLLGFDYRHFRSRFWIVLIPCIALWLSTLYLRYHYFVDVLAGVAVAGIGLYVSRRYEASLLAQEIHGEEQRLTVAAGPARR